MNPASLFILFVILFFSFFVFYPHFFILVNQANELDLGLDLALFS